jgi:hypothetical protein
VGDTGRAKWARAATSSDGWHGKLRISGRENFSMAPTSIDSHSLSPFPDRRELPGCEDLRERQG